MIGAATLALMTASAAVAADAPRADEIPAWCGKAATLKATNEHDACVARITADPASALYQARKAECGQRRTSYEGRYVGDCTKQLTRRLTDAYLWPTR